MEQKYFTNERNVQILIVLLKKYGIRKVIASPGTTNITFVASLMHDPYFELYSSVDERSAAYIACGLAEESGEPVVITCTGATASRNYVSGLTEAYYRHLPIIAVTATRDVSKIGHLNDSLLRNASSKIRLWAFVRYNTANSSYEYPFLVRSWAILFATISPSSTSL